MDVAAQPEVDLKVYSSPYHPQANRKIGGFHNFLKACLSKHVSKSLERDQVVPLACAAYHVLQDKHPEEIPFFFMFGRCPVVTSNSLLKPTVRYLGMKENILSLKALKNMYQVVVTNLELARKMRYQDICIQHETKRRWLGFPKGLYTDVWEIGIMDFIELCPNLK